MSFQEKYSPIFDIVKQDVERVENILANNIDVEEPLKSKLLELVKAPSKHIRAVVSFLYLKALGVEINKKQIIFQSAIELAHNASLIHDDIIDECTKRRSIETINSKFGNKLAVIAGDYLLSIALKKIRTLNTPEIIDMFAQTLDDMCQGEIIQDFNKYQITTIEKYIKKTELKTAKLFITALCGNLLLSETNINNGNDNYCFNPYDFARNFGIAFQIRDDLINIKTTKNDIKEGVYTAPVILANSVENFSNGIEKTQILLNNYIDSALREIEKFNESEYKIALTNLLGLIKNE